MGLELVKYLVENIVENKEAVSVTQDGETIQVVVDKADMGRVIGKQGRIAKSIRTIVKAIGAKENKKYNVDILEV